MALDPRIILGGQSPDVVGSMSRGIQTGQQMRQAQTQNALSDIYRTQGAGIMAGDEGALNALAGIDPIAAVNVQSNRLGMDATRLGMDATRQNMGMQVEQAKQKAMEYAQQVGAEQAEKEAAQLESTLKGASFFYSNGDQAGYDNFLRQRGSDPAEYPFDQFEPIAATIGGVLEVLRGFQPDVPEWMQATPEQAASYGASAGQINRKTGKFDAMNPPNGMNIQSDGAGGFSLQQGPGAGTGGGKPLTEGQSKDLVYVTRAEGALAVLDPIAGNLTSRGQRAAEFDPTGFARGAFQTPDFQVAKTAGDEFLQAILRKDTGAAITAPEQALYGVTYLPQPGDGADVLEYKAQARRRAVEAIKAGQPPSAIVAAEKALEASGSQRLQPVTGPQQIDGFTIEAIE